MTPTSHSRRERPGLRATHRAIPLLVALACGPARALGDDAHATAGVRFGIAREVFRDVNNNDAAVAVAAYSKTVGDDYGLPARVVLLEGPQALRNALKRNEIDLINISPAQLLDIDREDVEGPFLVSSSGPSPFEQYVLLVRTDGPIKNVRDLRGRSLVRSDDLRSSLAAIWLEVLLHQHGLASRDALGRVEIATRPTQAVLPVFFGKYDACVTTRAAWEVMGEMNPQVKAQLHAIAESPPVVSGMALFRRGIPTAMKQRILDVIGASARKPSFQQLMTLFKITNVTVQPASAFDSALQLLASYRAILSEDRNPKRKLPRAAPAPSAPRVP